MYLQEAVEEYLLHIRHERGLARRTCAVYASWLHNFLHWLAATGAYTHPTLDVFRTPVLRRYLHYLSERKLRPRTIRSAFNPIRGLSAFLKQRGRVPEDPAREIVLPKKDAARRTVTSDAEVVRLLEACERLPGERQVALVGLLILPRLEGRIRLWHCSALWSRGFSLFPATGSTLRCFVPKPCRCTWSASDL